MIPERGDLLMIKWWDISEDPVGDPSTGIPEVRTTYGLFWAQELRNGVTCLVTTTTIDNDGPHQSGYCCYPLGVVKSVTIVKKHGRKRVKKDVNNVQADQDL